MIQIFSLISYAQRQVSSFRWQIRIHFIRKPNKKTTKEAPSDGSYLDISVLFYYFFEFKFLYKFQYWIETRKWDHKIFDIRSRSFICETRKLFQNYTIDPHSKFLMLLHNIGATCKLISSSFRNKDCFLFPEWTHLFMRRGWR